MKENTFRKTTAALEVYFRQLLSSVEQPVFVKNESYPRWRFPNEGVAEAVLLKGARIISALNSLLYLLRGGYVQEMGVICRTIDEFFIDITFLLEGFPDKELSAPQRQFLKDFYQEEFDRPESPLESTQKRKTVQRQKLYAAVGRIFSDVVDTQQAQELFRTLGKTYSGYVHGAYPHVMELYGGYPPKFHLNGMLDTPRAEEWIENAKHYFYRAIQALMLIAGAFKNLPVFNGLDRVRAEFEKDAEYIPTGALRDVLRLQGAAKQPKERT